jgi:hypothetical protein
MDCGRRRPGSLRVNGFRKYIHKQPLSKANYSYFTTWKATPYFTLGNNITINIRYLGQHRQIDRINLLHQRYLALRVRQCQAIPSASGLRYEKALLLPTISLQQHSVVKSGDRSARKQAVAGLTATV